MAKSLALKSESVANGGEWRGYRTSNWTHRVKISSENGISGRIGGWTAAGGMAMALSMTIISGMAEN